MFFNLMELAGITLLNTTTLSPQGGERTEDFNFLHQLTIMFQDLEFTKLSETWPKGLKHCLNFTRFKQELLGLKINDLIGSKDIKHQAQELTYLLVILVM